MKTSNELAKELAAAKNRELTEAKQQIVSSFQSEIAGRSFVWRFVGRNNQRAIGYIQYGRKVILDTWFCENDQVKVKIEQRTVIALLLPSKKNSFEETSLKCDRRDETHEHIEKTKLNLGHEVSNDAFNSVWNSVHSITGAALSLWSDLANLPLTSPNDEEKISILDFPHLVLPHDEASIVSGSFLVSDTIYLLTQNSIRFALEKIYEAERIDSRCARLYEACDLAYVTRRRASLASLKEKLKK